MANASEHGEAPLAEKKAAQTAAVAPVGKDCGEKPQNLLTCGFLKPAVEWDDEVTETKVALAEFSHGHPPFSMLLPRKNFINTDNWRLTLNEREYMFHVAAAVNLISHLVPEDAPCHVLDFGGNIGYVAMMWASLGCQVQTWEANPQTAKEMGLSLALNDGNITQRVHLKNAAVSEKEGEVQYAIFKNGSIYDHVAHPEETGPTGTMMSGWKLQNVPALKPHLPPGLPVTFIKLDCEGCEPVAMQALESTLNDPKVRPWVILTEWEPTRMMAPGAEHMVKQLNDAGYTALLPEGDAIDHERLLLGKDNNYEALGDLFFVHETVPNFSCIAAAIKRDPPF